MVFSICLSSGNQAFRIHQRLLALVIRGRFIVMALRYFNVIAEDVIEADFQGINSRALALLLLQPCQPLLPVAGSQTQFIQTGMVPFPDDASLLDGHGRFIHQGALSKSTSSSKQPMRERMLSSFPAAGQGYPDHP